MRKKGFAVSCQADAVGVAVQQPTPEDLFQSLQVLADSRLSQTEFLTGEGEAAELGNRHETAQVNEIEHITFADDCYFLHRVLR